MSASDQRVKFIRPTIKDYGRAYVRLYKYFASSEHWLEFLRLYRVQHVPFGLDRAGDCAIRVLNRATGEIAMLGMDIPNEIKYHTYEATNRSFWTEEFLSMTHRRQTIIEIGISPALIDELAPR